MQVNGYGRNLSGFEEFLNPEITSVIIEYLTDYEVFIKLTLLSKSIGTTVHKLKAFPKIWRKKYLAEFVSNQDQEIYNMDEEGRDRFINNFKDNVLDPNDEIGMFNMYQRSTCLQKRMRYLVKGILKEISKFHTPGLNQDGTPKMDINTQLRPMKDRCNFSALKVGMPEDITFESYIFYRSFYNPQIEQFQHKKLEQYHVLLWLLEKELVISQTQVQGITLKFILYSAITCSTMINFLKLMHGADMIPLIHPKLYRQVVF